MTALAPAANVGVTPRRARNFWAALRVSIAYFWRHGRFANLAEPRLFTEYVQWRKLNDRSFALARKTDKAASKAHAASMVDPSMVVPTIWLGQVLPPEPPAPLPLMVKANHGCGQFVVVRSSEDWIVARQISRSWVNRTYGAWLDEWHYGEAHRAILIEPMLGDPTSLPLDYKVYVFHGRAVMVQVHEGRAGKHRWAQFDRDWRQLSETSVDVAKPELLESMLAAAEVLASDEEFLRVDFYIVDGKLFFGEYCLFPGSGLDPFRPHGLDEWLGECWGGQAIDAADFEAKAIENRFRGAAPSK